MFTLHPSLRSPRSGLPSASHLAAGRLADGAKRVQRDANPHRAMAVTFSHLGKLGPITQQHLQDLILCMTELTSEVPAREPLLVLGLAESGIIPSFAAQQACLARGQEAAWICSSRTASNGLCFREPHSHAPHHFLPVECFANRAAEVWIVEDEITTGKTLENLLQQIRSTGQVRRIRILTLLDTRGAAEIDRFDRHWLGNSLVAGVQSVLKVGPDFWRIEEQSSSAPAAAPIAPDPAQPRRLIAGESIAAALPALLSGEISQLQHVTLSPWRVDGRHVFSRQRWMSGYYLYNAEPIAHV